VWTKVAIFVLTVGFIVQCVGTPTQNHCPKTRITNRTKRWTENDQKVLEKAKIRCKEIYNDAPCLKRFEKLEELRYTARCGVTND